MQVCVVLWACCFYTFVHCSVFQECAVVNCAGCLCTLFLVFTVQSVVCSGSMQCAFSNRNGEPGVRSGQVFAVWCSLFTVQCAMYNVHCALCAVRFLGWFGVQLWVGLPAVIVGCAGIKRRLPTLSAARCQTLALASSSSSSLSWSLSLSSSLSS